MAEDGHIDPVISVESLPLEHAHAVGGVHPWFMGGEYLPDLLPNEVEIARVVMKSTTLGVISIRARKTKHRIIYRIVDEYMEEGYHEYPLIQETSTKPLTMKQLIVIIDNCQEDGGLMSSARNLNYSYSTCGPEEIFDFTTISSEFYPELSDWYDNANTEWLAKEQETINSRMEAEYEDPTEEFPKISPPEDTETRTRNEVKEKIVEVIYKSSSGDVKYEPNNHSVGLVLCTMSNHPNADIEQIIEMLWEFGFVENGIEKHHRTRH